MKKHDHKTTETCKHQHPDVIVLPVRPGIQPSAKPPVRIFVGSEPAQFRAERTFFWSIEQHRDPARVYKITLMKGLSGFDDRRWLTGFTNYRFAIPHYAGGSGKAIYNDTDQVYCDDPAKLFDLDLQGYACLAVAPRDTSVMLLDCAKMADIWTLERAQRWRKNKLIDAMLEDGRRYGALGGEWNARDEDHLEGWSKCVHFTTIHKQPWQPFPRRFVYQPNPAGELFMQIETAANAVGYNVYNQARPSAFFRTIETPKLSESADAVSLDPIVRDAIDELVARAGSSSLLDISPGPAPLMSNEPSTHKDVARQTVGLQTLLGSVEQHGWADGIVCAGALDALPIDDIPWVLDEIVGRAKQFILLVVRNVERRAGRRKHQGTVYQLEWWLALLEAACARRPEVLWSLLAAPGQDFSSAKTAYRQGGHFLGPKPPQVWLLEDHKPGHTTQSLGLVDALGWPCRRVKLEFGPLAGRPNFLRGPTLRGLTSASAQLLVAPWPDLVVATGARSAPVAEWIRRESRGITRTVHLGRKGAHLRNEFDLSVAPAYVGLYPDPRRIETTAPLTRVRQHELDAAAERWRGILDVGPAPRIALLVGGDDSVHALDAAQASRMGGEVATLARDAGGSVFVTTSRRTETKAARALVAALGNITVHSYHWSVAHHEHENPYLGYLALADILVVSGDSASMLAEASATGKPVFIYPLAERGKDIHRVKFLMGQQVSQWIMNRAFSRPLNRRGRERPQAGLELLCARLAARGWVRPHGDITKLHAALIERGSARYFDGKIAETLRTPLDEAEVVAARVRSLIGFDN
jgi:mitochondrial fission protein ELM1